MFRASGFACLAHDVLVEAEPALQTEGCDAATLLLTAVNGRKLSLPSPLRCLNLCGLAAAETTIGLWTPRRSARGSRSTSAGTS
jgi:hypothetical protein